MYNFETMCLQLPKIWCLPRVGEARASSLSKIVEEDVSSVLLHLHLILILIFRRSVINNSGSPDQCSHIIQKQKDPSKAHQIKLDVIVMALKWLEIDMDIDEVPLHYLFWHILFMLIYFCICLSLHLNPCYVYSFT